jgi:ATP-dependent Lon protease
MKRQYNFTIKGAKVFATANDLNKLSAPLRSRFRLLHLPKYMKELFLEIAIKVCPKLSQETAFLIMKRYGSRKDGLSL